MGTGSASEISESFEARGKAAVRETPNKKKRERERDGKNIMKSKHREGECRTSPREMRGQEPACGKPASGLRRGGGRGGEIKSTDTAFSHHCQTY